MGKENNPKKRTEEEWLESRYKEINTQGKAKLWEYFIHLTKSKEFRDKIDYIKKFKEKSPETFSKEIKKLCLKYYLHPLYWANNIKEIVDEKEPFQEDDYGFDVCYVVDRKDENEEPDSYKDDYLVYPTAIRISPYASQRDILDFVKKAYKNNIELSQRFYLDKNKTIAKVKKKNPKIQKRNDFIYENRIKNGKFIPYKELSRMVKEKFGETIDYEYIGKIISLERKKRKKV